MAGVSVWTVLKYHTGINVSLSVADSGTIDVLQFNEFQWLLDHLKGIFHFQNNFWSFYHLIRLYPKQILICLIQYLDIQC